MNERWLAVLLQTAPAWGLPFWILTFAGMHQKNWAGALMVLFIPGLYMLVSGLLVPSIAWLFTSGFVRARMWESIRFQGITTLIALALLAIAACIDMGYVFVTGLIIAVILGVLEVPAVFIFTAGAWRGERR